MKEPLTIKTHAAGIISLRACLVVQHNVVRSTIQDVHPVPLPRSLLHCSHLHLQRAVRMETAPRTTISTRVELVEVEIVSFVSVSWFGAHLTPANNCRAVSGWDCTICTECLPGFLFVADGSCQRVPNTNFTLTTRSIQASLCSNTTYSVATDPKFGNSLLELCSSHV